MPNLAEHRAVGNALVLKGLANTANPIKLENGLGITFGDIAGIAGDFIGADGLKIISTGPNLKEQQRRFLSAFENLSKNPDYKEYVKELVQHAKEETKGIENARKRGVSAQSYYNENALTRDMVWTQLAMKYPKVQGYLDLAGENVDHFGGHSIACYAIGHRLAVKEMMKAHEVKEKSPGDFEKHLIKGYAIEAFACHFFTDHFTSGHFRVPRMQLYERCKKDAILKSIGGLLAKAQHDEDGLNGLTFKNRAGHQWKVYGDCKLLDDVDGNEVQGREVIRLAMQHIVDELFDIADTGKKAGEKTGYEYFPKLHGENPSPLFKVKEGKVLRRSNVSDPTCKDYLNDWDAISTYWDILTSTQKRDGTKLVEKGDTIFVYPEQKQFETIKWQQDFTDYEGIYTVLPYLVKGKAKGPLFISEERVNSFFAQCVESDDESVTIPGVKCYKTQVTDAFQYGQNSEKTMRFLVYHDKGHTPYQHRFVQTSAFGNLMSTIFNVPLGEGSLEIFKGFIGDPLRDF